MAETKVKGKRERKSKQEMIDKLDKTIAYHENCIKNLKARKEEILNPKMTAKQQLKAVLAKAEEQGLSPEEIAKKLGVNL